jgi:hypothetical protein
MPERLLDCEGKLDDLGLKNPPLKDVAKPHGSSIALDRIFYFQQSSLKIVNRYNELSCNHCGIVDLFQTIGGNNHAVVFLVTYQF